jgi:hypothetical protein
MRAMLSMETLRSDRSTPLRYVRLMPDSWASASLAQATLRTGGVDDYDTSMPSHARVSIQIAAFASTTRLIWERFEEFTVLSLWGIS